VKRNADYQARIGRALALIEEAGRTGDWPDLAALASAAALSEFHFHRIYRLMTGETPQQTLTRARLGGSLPALVGREGIAGATANSAYATSQAYARALKALTGATPSQLRADPAQFAQVAASLSRPAEAGGPAPLAIEIVDLAPLRLMAVHRSGAYDDLNHGYAHLFAILLEQLAPEEVTGLYGVPHHDPRFTPAAECRFDCAVSTALAASPQRDMTVLDRPGGASLRLRLPGDYDAVHAALDQLYALALVLDLPLADHLPLYHYHHDPEEVPEAELLADLLLLLAA
jgi:AraC family transcriptional regulator